MVQTEQRSSTQGFTERFVEADGFRIRYLEAGQGTPLVYLHGAGGLRPSRAHEELARHYRVLAFEVPGFGDSPENTTSGSIEELALTMARAVENLGLATYCLWGTSFGGRLGAWLAIQRPEAIQALILESPGAIQPEGARPPAGTPEEMQRRLYAYPERQPKLPPPDPAVVARQRALLERLRRPSREETEAKLRELQVPTLVVFGTLDQIISPDMGRVYRAIMPSCHFVLMYDAGHELAAERPEAFAALVHEFVEYREKFLVKRESGLLHP